MRGYIFIQARIFVDHLLSARVICLGQLSSHILILLTSIQSNCALPQSRRRPVSLSTITKTPPSPSPSMEEGRLGKTLELSEENLNLNLESSSISYGNLGNLSSLSKPLAKEQVLPLFPLLSRGCDASESRFTVFVKSLTEASRVFIWHWTVSSRRT